MTIGRVLPSFSTAPASGSSSGTFRICELKRVIFMAFPLNYFLSLRGAERRSNPRQASTIGGRLLRFARNDRRGLRAVAVDCRLVEFEAEAGFGGHRQFAVLLHRHLFE